MSDTHIAFGPFRFDRQQKTLTRRGQPVALGHKAAVLLETLLDADGRPVSKDDLIAAAWPGQAIEDSNLTVQIAALRRILGQASDGTDWIATVQRYGYQLSLRHTAPAFTEDDAASDDSGLPRDRPSIAVMPFVNLTGESEQEYFCDGIVEEIIIALSQMRWLFVIARNSTFAYKGRALDIKQIGKELGVRYVLEGTVRRSEARVRITAQLSETTTATNIWAGRLEGERKDIFDLQDRVSASVIGAIAPKLEAAEIERVRRKPTSNLGAYDHFLRGMIGFHSWSQAGSNEALHHFYKAFELDPDYAAAYGLAARCYVQRNSGGWMSDRAHECREALRVAERAAELGRDDAVSLSTAGFALSDIAGRLEDGDALIERALTLNGNLSWAWLYSSWVKSALGFPEIAVDRVERAIALSPNDPQSFSFYAARAYAEFMMARFDEAYASSLKAAQHGRRDFLLYLAIAAASAARADRTADAQRHVATLKEAYPDVGLSDLATLLPLRRPADQERWTGALKHAGLT